MSLEKEIHVLLELNEEMREEQVKESEYTHTCAHTHTQRNVCVFILSDLYKLSDTNIYYICYILLYNIMI